MSDTGEITKALTPLIELLLLLKFEKHISNYYEYSYKLQHNNILYVFDFSANFNYSVVFKQIKNISDYPDFSIISIRDAILFINDTFKSELRQYKINKLLNPCHIQTK